MARNPMPAGRHDQILTRDNWRCQAPDRDPDYRADDCAGRLVVHHRKPRQMGGDRDPAIHDPERLITLCEHHHAHVHAHPTRSYDNGLLVQRTTKETT